MFDYCTQWEWKITIQRTEADLFWKSAKNNIKGRKSLNSKYKQINNLKTKPNN